MERTTGGTQKMATVMTWGNPYTHEEHERITYAQRELTAYNDCHWCGQRKARLYAYDRTDHIFCNRSCWNSYYR